jgi:SnoaL-like domain/SnoaL-like polyketide cyclase
MRTLPLLTLVSLVLVACASERVGAPLPAPIDWASFDRHAQTDAGTSDGLTRERATVNAYTDALTSLTSLAKLLDENAHLNVWGLRDRQGRENVVAAHDELFGAFEHRSFVASHVMLQRGSAAIEWTLMGVHARPWMDLRPSQHTIFLRGITLVTIQEDGEISDLRIMFDAGALKAQIAKQASSEAPLSTVTDWCEAVGGPLESANVQAVQRFLDDLEIDRPDQPDAGRVVDDEHAYLAAVTEDVRLEERGETRQGRDGARAYFRSMRSTIGQLDITVRSSWACGSRVVVEYTIGGEQLGPIGPIPFAANRVVLINTIDVMELRNGEVSHVWRYDDLDAILGTP